MATSSSSGLARIRDTETYCRSLCSTQPDLVENWVRLNEAYNNDLKIEIDQALREDKEYLESLERERKALQKIESLRSKYIEISDAIIYLEVNFEQDFREQNEKVVHDQFERERKELALDKIKEISLGSAVVTTSADKFKEMSAASDRVRARFFKHLIDQVFYSEYGNFDKQKDFLLKEYKTKDSFSKETVARLLHTNYQNYVKCRERVIANPDDEKMFQEYKQAKKQLGLLAEHVAQFEKEKLEPYAKMVDREVFNKLVEERENLFDTFEAIGSEIKSARKALNNRKQILVNNAHNKLAERKVMLAELENKIAFPFYNEALQAEHESKVPLLGGNLKEAFPSQMWMDFRLIFLPFIIRSNSPFSDTDYIAYFKNMKSAFKKWSKTYKSKIKDWEIMQDPTISKILTDTLYTELNPKQKCMVIQSFFYKSFCESEKLKLFVPLLEVYQQFVIAKKIDEEIHNYTLFILFKAKLGEKIYTSSMDIDKVIKALNIIDGLKDDKKSEEKNEGKDEKKENTEMNEEEALAFLDNECHIKFSPEELAKVRREKWIVELLPQPLIKFIPKAQIQNIKNVGMLTGKAENIEPKIAALNTFFEKCDYSFAKKSKNIKTLNNHLKGLNIHLLPVDLDKYYDEMRLIKNPTFGTPHKQGGFSASS